MAPRSLCLTTAFAPVPAFLGGSCPLGCSLSAPATGGLSMVSPQYIRYAAGSEEEKRADRRLHGGTIAQSFVFCKGGWTHCSLPSGAGVKTGGLLLVRGEQGGEGGGLMVAGAVVPPSPPSNVLGYRGTRCTPGRGYAPCTLLGGWRGEETLQKRSWPAIRGWNRRTSGPAWSTPEGSLDTSALSSLQLSMASESVVALRTTPARFP